MTDNSPAAKAERLINYFTTVELPVCPFKINEATTVWSCKKLIDINSATLRLARPNTLNFRSAYLNLYALKKYIQNECNSTNNSQ